MNDNSHSNDRRRFDRRDRLRRVGALKCGRVNGSTVGCRISREEWPRSCQRHTGTTEQRSTGASASISFFFSGARLWRLQAGAPERRGRTDRRGRGEWGHGDMGTWRHWRQARKITHNAIFESRSLSPDLLVQNANTLVWAMSPTRGKSPAAAPSRAHKRDRVHRRLSTPT